MKITANGLPDEKTVFVRDYLRLRNEKWEEITSHLRRPRRKRVQ